MLSIIIVSVVVFVLSGVTLLWARRIRGYADYYFIPAGSFNVCSRSHAIQLKPVRRVAKSLLIGSVVIGVYFSMMLVYVSSVSI